MTSVRVSVEGREQTFPLAVQDEPQSPYQPAGSQPQGITEWKPKSESQYQRNQVLECGTLGSGGTSQVVYIWTYPSQDASIVAQGEHLTTFSQLDAWWKAGA